MAAIVLITFSVFIALIYGFYLMIREYSISRVGKKYATQWSSKLYQIQSATFLSLGVTAGLLFLAKYFELIPV